MAGSKFCRVCRAMLTSTDEERSPGVCPYCGAETHAEFDISNPYAPPRTEPGRFGLGPETVTGVPASFTGKVGFAFKLLSGDFFLIASLILTVWIPGNLLINLLAFDNHDIDDQRRQLMIAQLTNLVEGVFGPLYMGGILYVLANRMTGHSSSYVEAFRVGFHNWGRLFCARFLAGIFIVAGIIALIVPGLILATRYALLDSVVVLEGGGISDSRRRSTELVRGKGKEIFAGGALYFLAILGIGTAMALIPGLHPALNNLIVVTVLDCIGNILNVIISCFLFGYYWEAQINKPEIFGVGLPIGKTSGFDNEL